MQDTKTVMAKNAPTIIQNKDLEYELLVKEARARHRLEDKEAMAIFQQGEIAADIAAANGDDREVIASNGRIRTGRGHYNKFLTYHQEKDELGLKTMLKALIDVGVAAAVIETWMKSISATLPHRVTSVASDFTGKARDIMADVVYDENFVYGGEEVSVRTADLFQKRTDRILALLKQRQSATTPEEYFEADEALTRILVRSKAFIHKDLGVVYDTQKVDIVNNEVDGRDGNACGVVGTFRKHGLCNVDSRGIKRLIGDQFEQDGDDVIGEVKTEPVVQVLRPAELNLVG